MRLTQFTDLALRLMVHLAANQGRRITIADAATACGASRFQFMKVANHLARNGLIKALKGRSGSIMLAAPPQQITVGAIVRAAEEDFNLVECSSGVACRMLPGCAIPSVLGDALIAFLAQLDRRSLEDLMTAAERPAKQQVSEDGSD